MEMVEKEKVYVEKESDDYASKGTGNAGLTLGIIGTSLAGLLWANKGGNLFGGCNSANCATAPTAYQVEQKECQDVVNLTNAFWQARVTGMNERFADRQTINGEMFGLYKSQIDGDFGLYKNQRDQFDVLKAQIDELRTHVAIGAAVRPYQDKLIQCEINDARKDADFNLWRRTCRMISGEVVLPSTPTVTGLPSYNPCACSQSAPTA